MREKKLFEKNKSHYFKSKTIRPNCQFGTYTHAVGIQKKTSLKNNCNENINRK